MRKKKIFKAKRKKCAYTDSIVSVLRKAFIGKAQGEYWEIDVATAMRNSKTEIRLPEIYYTLAYCNFYRNTQIRFNMKLGIFNCALLLVFLCNVQISSAQSTSVNCSNDSTVVTMTFENHDGDKSLSELITVYDLDSGISTSMGNYYPPGGPWSGYSGGNGYWNKIDTIYTTFGAIQEILTSSGSSNGWVNSKSITYSYTSTQKLEIYAIRTWNGSGWDSLAKKTWLYNAQDLIIETAFFQMQTGVWQKINMTQHDYNGGQPTSKTFLSGTIPGNIWEKDSLFDFSYTGNLRTQATVSYWDSINLVWQYFMQIPYQQFRDWSILRIDYKPKIVDGFLFYDTLYFNLDTSESMIYYRSVSFSNVDTIYNILEANIEVRDSARINGKLMIKQTQNGFYFMDLDVDSLWEGYYRTFVYDYSYDSYGRLFNIDYRGGCTNPCGGQEEYTFDSSGFITYHHHYNWTMVSDHNVYTYYSYFDSSSIEIIQPIWEDQPMVCPNSSYQPTLLVAGGCEPYQYHWYPSDGLSSDTVLNPTINVTDSMNYTVIVNDNAGHSDTLLYSIGPIYSVSLSVDTSNCSGPAILTAIEYPSADYQWYNNGVLMVGESNFQLITSLPGNYSVEIKHGGSSPYYGYISCTSSSDTIFVSNQNLIYFTQQAEICDGETYQLPDGIIADQSGNYISIVPATAGCDSSITTILTVNNNPIVSISSTDILCFGEASQVIISASGGVGPYTGTGSFTQYAGTTNYNIVDITGCASSQSLAISQPAQVVANAGVSISLCPGNSAILGGSPSGTGGTGTLTYQWLPAADLSSAIFSNPTATPLISTDYTLIVTDSNACSDSSIVSITVGTNVTPVIQQIGDTLFALASGVSYEWWYNGALLVSGNYPYIVATASGNYQVVFYDSLGCSGTSVITPIIITNIKEQDIVDAINIFPNPAFDNITLELPAKINEVLCTIYDLSGRKILSYKLTETRNQISVADFSAGGYMIGLIGEEFSGYKGLIIEK